MVVLADGVRRAGVAGLAVVADVAVVVVAEVRVVVAVRVVVVVGLGAVFVGDAVLTGPVEEVADGTRLVAGTFAMGRVRGSVVGFFAATEIGAAVLVAEVGFVTGTVDTG